jgi:AraC family transcriptional regulator
MSATADSAAHETVLYIKHMVCARGIRVVRQELESIGLQVLDVRLGAATVAGTPQQLDWLRIRATLEAARFALLDNFHLTLVERVNSAVRHLLRQRGQTLQHRTFGAAVARELGVSYPQLRAAVAKAGLGKTVAGYLLSMRLTYAQELLASSTLSVGQIARQLGYTSLAHFSGQFRRLMQCSPSVYRQQLRTTSEVSATYTPLNDASKRT